MPSEQIKIKVESNIFSDASNLMTAHSYSVSLPRTMTNDQVFALAYVPSADTGGKTTHTYLKASLYIDGVPMFIGGRCVLSSVEDKGYKINLYWGLLSVFEEIKREGLNLCELPNSTHWNESTMANWIQLEQYDATLPQYKTGMTSAIYNTLDDESKELADTLPWLMPSVSANEILSKIAQVYGLSYNLSTWAASRIDTIWHPLTTRKVMAKDEHLTFTLHGTWHLVGATKWITLSPNATDKSSDNIYLDAVEMRTGNTGASTLYAFTKINAKTIRIVGSSDRQFTMYVNNGDKYAGSTWDAEQELYIVDKTLRNTTVEKGNYLIALRPADNTSDYGWSTSETPVINVDIYVDIDDAGEVYVDKMWDYVRNYPDISVVNYLSEMLAHIGGCIVGSVTNTNTLNIVTFDELIGNEPVDVNSLGVKTITMSLDKLAQKNIYKHKPYTDDESDWEADGVIYTADTTLELQRTAFDSKFKVPKNSNIRLWKVEPSSESGKKSAKWEASGDYITNKNGDTLFNYNLDFEAAIEDYYSEYEKVAQRPKVIVVTVRMGVLDLLAFDFTRPVYIKQLNRKYMVKTLETDSNDTYKLTLVQI